MTFRRYNSGSSRTSSAGTASPRLPAMTGAPVRSERLKEKEPSPPSGGFIEKEAGQASLILHVKRYLPFGPGGTFSAHGRGPEKPLSISMS